MIFPCYKLVLAAAAAAAPAVVAAAVEIAAGVVKIQRPRRQRARGVQLSFRSRLFLLGHGLVRAQVPDSALVVVVLQQWIHSIPYKEVEHPVAAGTASGVYWIAQRNLNDTPPTTDHRQ